MKRNAKTWTDKDGWKIETYLSKGDGLRQTITSPSGLEAEAGFIGFDGRLKKHRTKANIEFGSINLSLSEALADRMIAAAQDWFTGLELGAGEVLSVSADSV